MPTPEPKLTRQHEIILEKLKTWRGPGRLTIDEIDRIRADFVKEDHKAWLRNYTYNLFSKAVFILGGLGTMGAAIALLKGWVKL